MINLLTAEMLSLEQITKNTPPQNVTAGRDDYQAGRVTIETVGQSSARLQVLDHKTNRPYAVSVWLHARQIALSCTCRDSYQWYLCRHRVASALALREHLLAHPPKLWQAVLEQTSQPPARRPNVNYGPIVFSLQERSNSWAVVPYSLAARLFLTHELGDRAAVAATIERLQLSAQAKPIRSRISRQGYPGASETELAAVNLAVGNPYMLAGYSYGRENAFYEPVLPLLPGSLVYTGHEGDPLQARVEVLPALGTIEAELRQAKQGLRLVARVVVGDRTLPIKRRDTTVIVADPPWLLLSGTLVQLKSADGLASALLEYPELVIPPEDEETFLEKHLLPLTEHVTVRGDMIEWHDVDAEPQPRLYLSEAAEGLQAELRFGYGAYELAYDKRLPSSATLRQPGTATLARITRRPAGEQEAWQNLAAYGLKRGPEPQLWLVKKSTHPVDFLMHQVPKLAEAGYTIYGEEALTLARVNRNKPSISFNVSSGIDWFDVTAVVNYGDLAVSLKTIRQAIKRREKYVKLADGTIGQLPEEWIERYRHMLALGEEHGDDLRFSQHHITMLDQLLSDADRARTDEAFERRREKLRGFERIEPHPLPTTFKGELRPYQKFGYDWMHFLREYGFGGCLADDMGTGKCVAPDTAILVNGIPQAAELVWNTYAKPESFDGDGYWAAPSERLLVNSIDEQTGQITQAPIRRLYRQWVRERLRTVVLEDGHRITITQQHRLLTRGGWTNQLAVGDYVCVPARAQIQQLLDLEVFFCRISAIEEVEYTGWVYDFEVEQHHNFVANGMLCHNTIQTLAFLESLYEADNQAPASLIVMPRSLLFNWQREAEKFAPELAVYVHADQGRIADPAEFAKYDLVLTTYGTMLRDVEKLRQYQFNYAILDESQAIKNPLAETSKAARLLRADHRLVLTGTPIENSTLELWSQFAFLNPGLLGDISYFREQFVTPIERQQSGDTAQFLRKMVFPFILRRTKDQVAADLPPRSEEIVMCDMEPAQRKLYDKQRDYYRALLLGLIDNDGMNDARMKILEGLLRLRQISNHPRLVDAKFKGVSGKFELLLDTLDTLRAEGHRALVFSQFVQMLTIVREALDARGVAYCYLDGQTRDRQGEVDRFQNDDAVPFFLISLKAGGVGLNLTAADYVIHIDPWWNPAVEMQATDRTHRIGQDKPVFVYKLIARDSVEEKILQLQDHKRALVEQVIGAEGGVFKSLTRDDIEVLFS